MADGDTYQVAFDTTDDAEHDAETTLLEDQRHTLAEVQDHCRRYGVRARVSVDGQSVVADVDSSGVVTWR